MRYQLGMQNVKGNLKATDVRTDPRALLDDLEIPANSKFAQFILGGEADFNMFKKNLSLAESKRIGAETQKRIENTQEHIKKQNKYAKSQRTMLEYKIEEALKRDQQTEQDNELEQECEEYHSNQKQIAISNKKLIDELDELKLKLKIEEVGKQTKVHALDRTEEKREEKENAKSHKYKKPKTQ